MSDNGLFTAKPSAITAPPMKPVQAAAKPITSDSGACPTCGHTKRPPVDYDDDSALRKLARHQLAVIIDVEKPTVAHVGAIRELIDRLDGKAPQSIALDVKDSRMDRLPIDKLLRLASMLDEPVVIGPMPSKLDDTI